MGSYKKKSTVYILGAGASYASNATEYKIPLQKGFFARIASIFPPISVFPIFHDIQMSQWLVSRGYGSISDPAAKLKTNYDLNLEDFYSEIENDTGVDEAIKIAILKVLDRTIFQAVSNPVVSMRQHREKTCFNHKYLAKKLRSGDSVVSFNYDSLIDDAMLYYCSGWHPLTGHGVEFDDVYGEIVTKKAAKFESSVLLLKPHGSVTFRYNDAESQPETKLRYIAFSSGLSPLNMSMAGGWKPLIVPPSTSKSSHQKYMNRVLDIAKTKISDAKKLIVIGYSFPANDAHINQLFENFNGQLYVVNPDWNSESYLSRIEQLGLRVDKGYFNFEDFSGKPNQV